MGGGGREGVRQTLTRVRASPAGGTFGRSPAEAAARGVQRCADVTQRATNDASVEKEPLQKEKPHK